MKTQEFLDLLKEHQNKSLLFSYLPNSFVGTNYHITEIKNIKIDSVDCGAQEDSWSETIVQLWESPDEIGKKSYLSVYKALSILKKVDRIKPMIKTAEIRFEYGNAHFHSSQLFVSDFLINDKQLIINLSVYKTDCKAKEVCGIDSNKEEVSCCEPSSNCC